MKHVRSPRIYSKEPIPPEPVFVDLLRSPRIDSHRVGPVQYNNPFCRTGPPGYIGWRNRFLGSINIYKYGLRLRSLAGRYDNPIPTPFLAPIDCLTLIRMTKDEKVLAFFKGLLLKNVLSVKKLKKISNPPLVSYLSNEPISGS